MSKIKVKDLKDYATSVEAKDALIEVGGMEIELKQQTTLLEKVAFAAKVYNASVSLDDGKHLISRAMYKVLYVRTFIESYTNLTLPKDSLEGYDLVVNSGLFEQLYNSVRKTEVEGLEKTVLDYIEEKEDEFKQDNSTEKIIGRMLDGINEMIPSSDQMSEMFSNLSGAVDYDALDKLNTQINTMGKEDEKHGDNKLEAVGKTTKKS